MARHGSIILYLCIMLCIYMNGIIILIFLTWPNSSLETGMPDEARDLAMRSLRWWCLKIVTGACLQTRLWLTCEPQPSTFHSHVNMILFITNYA